MHGQKIFQDPAVYLDKISRLPISIGVHCILFLTNFIIVFNLEKYHGLAEFEKSTVDQQYKNLNNTKYDEHILFVRSTTCYDSVLC